MTVTSPRPLSPFRTAAAVTPPWPAIVQVLAVTLMLMLGCLISGHSQMFSNTKAYSALGSEIGATLVAPRHTPSTAILRGQALPSREVLEQTRLAYAVAATRSVWRTVWHPFFQYKTREVLNDPTARYRDPAFAIFTALVPWTDGCRAGTASCASRLDIPSIDAVIGFTLLAALLVIGLLLARANMRVRWLPLALALPAGLAGNAVICGTLSGNAARHQARITWLVPMLATFMLSDALRGRNRARRA